MTFQELKITSYLMEVVSRGDRNFEALSGQKLNLNNKEDGLILLKFLNSWGCRQFIIEQHPDTAKRLKQWFKKFEHLLPPDNKSLTDLSDLQIKNYSLMFDELRNIPASTNVNGVTKRVGPVGAAKALFALRKHMFPPWDNPIGDDLQYQKNGEGYVGYMVHVKGKIQNLKVECDQLCIELNDIPKILNRPSVTLVKLIDEYLWLTITRGFDPKAIIELSKPKKRR